MIYLSGAITQTLLGAGRSDLGVMLQPGMGNKPATQFIWHALDNGCFAENSGGVRFDSGNWLEWVAGMRRGRQSCLFVTAPDVMCDASATIARSLPFFRTIRQLGFKAALVAQNGIEDVDVPWAEIDCLFLGGDTGFKYSAAVEDVVCCAKSLGLWCHMGRVNSLKRLQRAKDIGCDSADGTFLAFNPDVNFPRMIKWLDEVNG